mmetsp:Transcript_1816/g.7162  ORF Transcript_1816/g.7162 Transcript_1816/m.7162 type:complete len:256 (-) Transcript_1816:87-854(-)
MKYVEGFFARFRQRCGRHALDVPETGRDQSVSTLHSSAIFFDIRLARVLDFFFRVPELIHSSLRSLILLMTLLRYDALAPARFSELHECFQRNLLFRLDDVFDAIKITSRNYWNLFHEVVVHILRVLLRRAVSSTVSITVARASATIVVHEPVIFLLFACFQGATSEAQISRRVDHPFFITVQLLQAFLIHDIVRLFFQLCLHRGDVVLELLRIVRERAFGKAFQRIKLHLFSPLYGFLFRLRFCFLFLSFRFFF